MSKWNEEYSWFVGIGALTLHIFRNSGVDKAIYASCLPFFINVKLKERDPEKTKQEALWLLDDCIDNVCGDLRGLIK
jgi:hypothetical protein